MGALQGSISYTRCFVRGNLPPKFQDKFLERIRLRVFEPLRVDDEAEERAGFCVVARPFDLDLSHDKVFYNSYLNLGLRIDRWKIPKPLFRAHFAEAEAALLAKKGRERLSRNEKADLKVMVARKLRKQVLPSMRLTDLSWNLDAGVVRVFSHSAQVLAHAEGLFQQAFELELVPESPFTAAVHLGFAKADADRLATLEPAPLSDR